MNPSVRRLLDYLQENDVACEAGLDEAALNELESALGASLPAPMRELYSACGVMSEDALDHLPMRLMAVEDVLDTLECLREGQESYCPSPDARYLFSDDNSNWAGIYVTGPLTGKIVLLDHDDPSEAPRFRSLSSFIDAMIAAGRDGSDFTELSTDYPLAADCEESLARDALPIARQLLENARSSDKIEVIINTIEVALHLLPASEVDVLRELLSSPHQFVRYKAVKLAGHQKQAKMIQDLVEYADLSRKENNYTHWSATMSALISMGAKEAVEKQRKAVPKSWPMPG